MDTSLSEPTLKNEEESFVGGMPRNMFQRKKHFMTTGGYFVVASIIKAIPDPSIRQMMADHFATEFNKRSPSFDPYEWGKATGGKVAANSAA